MKRSQGRSLKTKPCDDLIIAMKLTKASKFTLPATFGEMATLYLAANLNRLHREMGQPGSQLSTDSD